MNLFPPRFPLRWLPFCLALLGAVAVPLSVPAQTLVPGQPLDPLALTWPRQFATNGYEFAAYQPQISQWPGNQIQGRIAIAVRPAGTSNETYGVVFFTARTEIDKVNRLVTLEDLQVTKVNFPTQKSQQGTYQAIVQSELPQAAKTIPLDHLEAVFVVSGEVQKAKLQPVANTPPRIIYTTQPSLLVQVDGMPNFQPLVQNYERVANTRAVLLLNTNVWKHGYYLYAAGNWYTAPSLEGPWTVDITPPSDSAAALTAALATGQADAATPKTPLAAPLTVYVSTVPTELLQSGGMANLLSLAGTDLLYVANSDNAIFYDLDDANDYVLISGRWFKSPGLYAYTGNAAAGKSGSWYNPSTGASAQARSGATANASTGNYAVGKQASGYNPSTGTYGAASGGTSGNAYTGQSSSYDRGVVGNTQTGNKAAWNNGNLYTDSGGNVNKYSADGSGSYDKYGSGGWNKASSSMSSSMDHESWGQSMGSQRADSWSRGGGGGWGGSRGGGGFRR